MQIIPSPRRVMPGNGVLRLGREITVSCSDTALAAVTGRFCSGLERRTGIRARVTPRGVKLLMSPVAHCYLDVPYAEQSADPAQARRRERVGLRNYRPLTLQESFSWEPVAALGA